MYICIYIVNYMNLYTIRNYVYELKNYQNILLVCNACESN